MKNDKIKIFLSYSHKDDEKNNIIEKFISFIKPLIRNNIVDVWYDGKIIPGGSLEEITPNLENSDIICLFISANFLSSNSCEKEKQKAIDFHNNKNKKVVPIILSPCLWNIDKDIYNNIKVLPKDGKPISKFDDEDDAWYYVVENLNITIDELSGKKQFINSSNNYQNNVGLYDLLDISLDNFNEIEFDLINLISDIETIGGKSLKLINSEQYKNDFRQRQFYTNKVADYFNDFAEKINSYNSTILEHYRIGNESFIKLLTLHKEYIVTDEEKFDEFKLIIKKMPIGMDETIKALNAFITPIMELPAVTDKFDKARQNIFNEINDLSNELNDVKSNLLKEFNGIEFNK